LNLGIFGSSTGAAGALIAAARRPDAVDAVVSRGGRVDLAEDVFGQVQAPALFIVGGNDVQVRELNRQALSRMEGENEMEVVSGAGHLFEGPGELDQVAALARHWFQRHLG
jgi:pimeloyl-ACP methyl ester carboxylesterase